MLTTTESKIRTLQLEGRMPLLILLTNIASMLLVMAIHEGAWPIVVVAFLGMWACAIWITRTVSHIVDIAWGQEADDAND